jgi:hypothetical protein
LCSIGLCNGPNAAQLKNVVNNDDVDVLTPHPILKMEDLPLLAVCDRLFNITGAILHPFTVFSIRKVMLSKGKAETRKHGSPSIYGVEAGASSHSNTEREWPITKE